MTLRLHNSLGDREEEFRPADPAEVHMYHCGPTVKEPIDIAKFRGYLLADLLRRWLERSGWRVRQVMNVTDVGHLNEFEEDIVEIAAGRSGLYAWELVEREEGRFHEERRELRIRDADVYPRAREHIEDMVEFVQELEAKGVTYRAGGNLYLDVSRFQGFGRLCGRTPEELESLRREAPVPGAPEKRHPLDIDLWRTDAMHQMRWDSPWGRGFPGWHVECVAMSRKYLGDTFDIHTGSHDNVFPHHECEMAQAELLTGKPLARYWLHSGPVTVDGQPMGRREGNRVTARELLDSGFRGNVVRAALLSAPYRQTLDFGDAALDWGRETVDLLNGFRDHLREAIATSGDAGTGAAPGAWISETEERFRAALDDDLDWPAAATAVRDALMRLEPDDVGDPQAALDALLGWDEVLGLL